MERGLKALYFLAIAAEVIIRLPCRRQHRGATAMDQRITLSERIVLGSLTIITGVRPLVKSVIHRLDFADYLLPPGLKRLVSVLGRSGAPTTIWAATGRHRSRPTPSRPWSPAGCTATFAIRCAPHRRCGASAKRWC